MVGVDFIYLFRMNGGIYRGEFGKAVQDSGRDHAETTGCVGVLLSNVLKLLSLFTEHSKLQVPVQGTSSFSCLGMGIHSLSRFELVLP